MIAISRILKEASSSFGQTEAKSLSLFLSAYLPDRDSQAASTVKGSQVPDSKQSKRSKSSKSHLFSSEFEFAEIASIVSFR